MPQIANETWVVIGALAAGTSVMGVTVWRHALVRTAWRERRPLGRRRRFDFNTAWATNFAVAGAAFDSILSANASDKSVGPFLSWHSYQLLAMLFAALIVLAPFMYRQTTRSFIYATGLTLAAVVGQTCTSVFLVVVLGQQAAKGSNPIFVSDLLALVLGATGLRIVYYVWMGVPKTVKEYQDRGSRSGQRAELTDGLETAVAAQPGLREAIETVVSPREPEVPLPA